MHGGQARQLGGDLVVVGILVQRRQQGEKRAVGIAEVGVVELRRPHQTAGALARVPRARGSLDEERHQIRPALLAEVGALQLAEGIHRGRDVVVDEGIGILRQLGVVRQRLAVATIHQTIHQRKREQPERIWPTAIVERCWTGPHCCLPKGKRKGYAPSTT